MQRLLKLGRRFHDDRGGGEIIEYGILLALVVMVCLVTVGAVGGKVVDWYTHINTEYVPTPQ